MQWVKVVLSIVLFVGAAVESVQVTTLQPTTVHQPTPPGPFTEYYPTFKPDTLYCISTGDPHFITFDGTAFEFQGVGKFLLARYDDPINAMCKISVVAKHENRGSDNLVSWNTYVEVKLHNSGVTIKLDRGPEGGPPRLTVDGLLQNAPYYGSQHGSPNFEVVATVGILVVKIIDCPTFEVSFDGWRTVRVAVNETFSNFLSGLCTESDGSLGWRWEVRDDDSPDIPQRHKRSVDYVQNICSDIQRVQAETKCNVIFTIFGGLSATGLQEHIQITFHQCVFDVCNDLTEGNDPDPTICAYLEDFNMWLIRIGAESVMYHHHPGANCPLDCGINAEYSYQKPCYRTCQHDPQLPVPCSEAPIWVCMCKDGFVLSGGECVPQDECGCTTNDGRYYKPGEFYVRSDCMKMYTCEITKEGPKFIEETLDECLKNKAECKVNPESGHRECMCKPGLLGDGRLKCELPTTTLPPTTVHQPTPPPFTDPYDTCERLRPCKNGGTCTNEADGGYKCCCSEGWTGLTCEERELPRKPPGPYSECILEPDPKGLMYFGTKDTTTSGRKCQPWASHYPHRHAYHKVLAEEDNYCRNRVHGIKGLYGPWCYTMDPNKKWEYCDNIPKCSQPNVTFPVPPEHPGCYKRSDKGESYIGFVWFSASGKSCKKWGNYPHNYCRNPGGMRKKPWCWTRDGKEDCDIDICALPPPVPGEDACTVDTSTSVCASTIKLGGNCYFRHRLYEECDFTVVTISSITYDIYIPDVTKELYWKGIGGQERFTSHTCRVTFEVSGYHELTIKFPICGWCAKKTFRSYMTDVNGGTKTCPGP